MTDTAVSPNIKDSSDQAFMADVVEASNDQPVLVDFWAPWCGPCKTLTPTLEKVVSEQNGKVKLVKINTEEHPGIAGQMGVRSIPSVFAFDKGRPVNGFQGALPEGQVRQFIESILGGTDDAKQLQEALEQAEAAVQAGDIGTAAQLYSAVIDADPKNPAAIAGLARCYLANGDPERARQILDMAPEDKANDPAIKSVRTALDLMAESPLDEEIAQSREAVAANPNDPQARFDLAEKLIGNGKNKDASEHLLAILAHDLDWEDGKAKAKLLEIFEAAGPKDPGDGRRATSSRIDDVLLKRDNQRWPNPRFAPFHAMNRENRSRCANRNLPKTLGLAGLNSGISFVWRAALSALVVAAEHFRAALLKHD